MQTTDQTLTMFGNTSSSSSLVDDMASKPILPATTTSQPIDIPFKQTSPQLPSGDRMLTSRKRRDNAHLSDPQWRTQHVMEREQLNLAYQRVVSPARDSTAGSSKRPKEGILRRTSTSCRNKFQKAIHGRSRRSSVDTMDDIEQDIMAQPQQIVPQQQPRALHRLLNIAKPSRNDTPQPLPGAASTSRHFIPSQRPVSAQFFNTNLPPNHPPRHYQHPYDTRGGALARKAVSSHTSKPSFDASPPDDNYLERREQNRRRLGSHSSAADSGADICSSSSDTDMPDAPLEPEIKIDPLSYLPSEINAIIFSHLDAASLRNCQQIPQWRSLAADSLIWRGEYLRSFDKDNYVSPAPIQIGGVGIGKPDVRVQNWQLMHSAREQINANWEMGKGRAIYMAGHTDSVYCVQFDEKKIITGSRDRTIRVWDLNTNRCIKVIGGPAVRPAPGPRVLRTVDYPSFHHAEASVNATPYGAAIYHVPSDFHSASILCLQYDEEILVTGSSDNDLIVWDLETYEPIRRLKQHQGGVLDVAFDAKHIVSCSKDCTIVVWDRKTLLPLRTLNGHNGPVNAVQLRGNLLVSASGDGVARLWDLNKMECVREFPAKERGLAAVEFSDDAKYVLAGGNDHVTYKFEVATGKEVLTYSGHSQLVRSLFLDTQNKRVVSGSYDLDLRVYDYDSGRLITVFPEWTTSWMLAAKCDYRRIVSTSQDGRILMIDFGINQDGQKIEGVDLLAGCEASKGGEQ